jgi:hypothetical protein
MSHTAQSSIMFLNASTGAIGFVTGTSSRRGRCPIAALNEADSGQLNGHPRSPTVFCGRPR